MKPPSARTARRSSRAGSEPSRLRARPASRIPAAYARLRLPEWRLRGSTASSCAWPSADCAIGHAGKQRGQRVALQNNHRNLQWALLTTQVSGIGRLVENEPLTPPQAELLATIRDRVRRGEPAPSYRDLCAEFGWASTGTARDHLQALARKGYITLGGGRARQVRLVDEPAAVARVRVLGRVVAGRPAAVGEVDEGEIAVPAAWLTRGHHFALTVDGDSMRDAAILDGDTVVVREQCTAQHGEVVVATVAGETTVKRLDIGVHGIRLLAENPRFAPIDVQDGEVTIHGAVIAVMRRLAPAAPGKSTKGLVHVAQPLSPRSAP